VPVQLRFASGLTGEQYVTQEGWRLASLAACPLHPRGRCGFARHGSYERKRPAGVRIARWYCPQGHRTFGLLPDCLAARFPGTLAEIEWAVGRAAAAPSQERAADELRPDAIGLVSAKRWLQRRVRHVRRALIGVVSLLPSLAGCAADLGSVGARLACAGLIEPGATLGVLASVRGLVGSVLLPHLPAILGFAPPLRGSGVSEATVQQPMGPDPPHCSS
jgi:hypothetical protein